MRKVNWKIVIILVLVGALCLGAAAFLKVSIDLSRMQGIYVGYGQGASACASTTIYTPVRHKPF